MSQGRVIYTPFISKQTEIEIPESIVNQPIPISFPKDTQERVIPGEPLKPKYDLSQYNSKKSESTTYELWYPIGEKEDYNTVEKSDKPIEWKFEFGVLKPKIGNTYSDRKKFVKDLTEAYEKELDSRGLSKEYAKYIAAQDALESN